MINTFEYLPHEKQFRIHLDDTLNCYFTIDEIDFDKITTRNWCLHKDGYARTSVKTVPTSVSQFILGDYLDHKDRVKLNNTRSNLRFYVYQAENTYNQSIRSDNTSGYKGVTWHKQSNRWRVQIQKNGKKIHIGMTDSLEEAALMYNKKAVELFGEYAFQNTIA